MVLNATFNNISAISWRSVLLIGEIEVPVENHQPAANHFQTLSQNDVSNTPHHEPTTLVVMSTDCIGSSKSNFHTITSTTATP